VAEERKLNWIDRRARRESLLKGADGAWNQVRAAIQDACDSFNKHYPAQAPVQCEQENGNRLCITRTIPADPALTFGARRLQVLVTFTSAKITAVYNDRSSTYKITADDESVFVVDRRAAGRPPEHLDPRQLGRTDRDRRMPPDDLSEAILKSILFPLPDETRPRAGPGDGNATYDI
jgi:hypothetical protein